MARRQGRQRHRAFARQRHRRHRIKALEAQHFLDQVIFGLDLGAALGGLRGFRGIERRGLIQADRCGDVVAPGRNRNGYAGRIARLDNKAQAFERSDRLIGRNIRPAEASDPIEPHGCIAPPGRFAAGLGDGAGLTAAQFHDQRGGGLDRIGHQRGIQATLKPLARIGNDLMATAGASDADGVEQRAFDEHAGCRFIASGGLTADHAGDGLHPGGVADRAVLGIDNVVLAVQGAHRLAGAAAQGQRVA